MRTAWVCTEERQVAADIADALAELGFAPAVLGPEVAAGAATTSGTGDRPSVIVVAAAPRRAVPGGLCRSLRRIDALSGVPVLLAVEREHLTSTRDLTTAHELIVRPFSRLELEARIARALHELDGTPEGGVVQAGAIEVDLATYQVRLDGQPVAFTYMEYELLKFLITHPGRVYTREALLKQVWGYDYFGGVRTVDVHIRRVRSKLGAEAARVRTIRSVGYAFDSRPGWDDAPSA